MSRFDEILNKLKEQATRIEPGALDFDAFLEKLIAVLGGKQDAQDKLRIISRMAFDAKRNTEHRSEDAENEGDAEEGELMTHMKQKGMISGSSKPSAIFTGTREKR